MASCIFITAAEARQNPLRERVVHDEACGIASSILDAVRIGLYETTVSDGTPMTNSSTVVSEAWTVDASTDQLYVPNHVFSTGDAVTLSSTISLPSPLRTNQYYYVIFVDNDHLKLASSYQAAVAGRPISIDITSGVTQINLTEQGSGYLQPPVVTVSGGGASSNALARANLAPWASIIGISNGSSGSGYNDSPTVQIVPQGSGATYSTVSYCVVGISVASPGIDYRVGDIISVIGGSGTASTAVVTAVSPTGQILGIQLSNSGSYSSLPSLVSASTSVLPGGGSGATVNLTIGIKSIALSTGGSGYAAAPRIRIVDPSGVGATAVATLTGGSISSVSITNPGYGYVGVTDVVFDSGTGATALASLVPSGLSSVTITDQGSGYTSPPSVTVLPVGSGCAAGTVTMKIVNVQMTNSGTNYQKDDILLVSGGVATENAYLRVTSVSSTGSITSFVLESGGLYTTLPGLVSNPVTGGSGILAGFNCIAGVASISVASPGSGYQVPPIVTVVPPSGSAARTAVAQAMVTSGQVTSFRVLDPGQGYQDVPTVTVSNGNGASATAYLSPTSVGSILVQNPGSGYTTANVVITGGGNPTINAVAVAVISGTSITDITIIDPGEGYTSAPNVAIDGDGNGALVYAVLSGTSISDIEVTAHGSGYNTPPIISIDGNATAVGLLESTGIDRIVMVDQGENYTSDPVVYLIPGPYQSGTPLPPPLTAQRGYSIASISVTDPGVGYSSVPSVNIGLPQIPGGVPASADASIGAGSGTFAIMPYPASRDYFKIWKSQVPSNPLLSRPYEDQMNTIIKYFTDLGYNINRLTNPSTNSTIMWKIQW